MLNLPECMYDYRGVEEETRLKVGHCCECDEALYEGQTAYYILGKYWCVECLEACKETL